MSKKEKKDTETDAKLVSRRQFLKSAGMVAGGIGAAAFLSACSPVTTTVTSIAPAAPGSATSSVPNTAAQSEVIKWKGQYSFPSTLPYGPFTEEYAGLNACYTLWTNWVTKATNGRLQIDWSPAGSIFPITDADTEVGKGTVQIAASSGLYYTGRFPAGNIEAGGVFFWKSSFEVYEAYYKYGLVDALNKLYAKKNLVYLPNQGGSINGIGVNFEAPTLDSIKGKKIRAVGVQGDYIGLLGGSPVSIALGDTYMALKTGTVDGWVAATGLLEANKYKEVTKGFVVSPLVSPTPDNVIINMDAFKALPQDIQNILMTQSQYAGFASASTWHCQCQWALEQAEKNYNLQVYSWSDADQAKAYQLAVSNIWPKLAGADADCAALMKIIEQQARDYGRIT